MMRLSRAAPSYTVVFIFAAVSLLLMMDRQVNVYDEGIVLNDALRVMRGDVIHRDFISVYGPGSYATLGLLFGAFGKEFIVGRAMSIVTLAGVVCLSFALLNGAVRSLLAFGAAGLVLLWLMSYPCYLYPLYPCLLLSIGGSILLLRPKGLDHWSCLLGAGTCSGISAYFRYDLGFATLVAHMVSIAIYLTLYTPRGMRVARVSRACIIYCVASGITFLPVAIYLLLNGSFLSFRMDVIEYGLQNYARTRHLPFPRFSQLRLSNIGVYLPLVSVMLGLLSMRGARWEYNRDLSRVVNRSTFSRILLMTVTSIYFFKGVVRVEIIHMILAIVPATLLIAIVVDGWWESNQTRLRGLAILSVLAATLPALSAVRVLALQMLDDPRRFVIGIIAENSGVIPRVVDPTEACIDRLGMRGAWLPDQYVLAARFLADHTSPRERILVGTDRHDRVFGNPMILYFAADRSPATRWDVYDPGFHTRAAVQQAIVSDLKRNHVHWIVRDASFDDIIEPNESAKSSGVKLLDEYISENYRAVAEARKVVIWLRRDVVAPLETEPRGCRMKRL